jgi:hypothetical protein
MEYTTLKSGFHYFRYDSIKYPFHSKIQEIFATQHSLEDLHTQFDLSSFSQVTFDNDTATMFHKKYYKSEKYHEVIAIYNLFLENEIVPMFKEDLVVQKEPSFRVCVPNNTALGKLSTDTNEIIGLHCDGDYNHPKEELNIMLSVTGQHDTNSCYAETEPGKGDFQSIDLEPNQYMTFYGNQCRHYNRVNVTGKTRVSFDFRIIPKRLYTEVDSIAVHSGRKFTIGGYYKLLEYKPTSD